ncbi:11619_t:CDS:2, partial [Acaulospora colombiana]
DVYDFDQIGNELETIRQSVVQNGGNWVADFAKLHNSSQIENFNDGWVHEYAKFDQPLTKPNDWQPSEFNTFEKAFNNVDKDVNWETEFIAQEKSWESEFNDQEQQKNNNSGIDVDSDVKLSINAGKIVQSVSGETNPKFKNSMFMNLMRKLRDNEVHIEGNKFVEQKLPVSKVDWVSEFEARHKDAWASEFEDRQENSSNSWSQEFTENYISEKSFDISNKEESRTLHKFEPTANPKDWAFEFQQSRTPEFNVTKNSGTLLKDDMDSSWEEYCRDLDEFQPYSMGYKSKKIDYNYEFQQDNPYLNRSNLLHEIIVPDRMVKDSILALEAAVQLDPNNAGTWHQLGIKQQENEQESQAIAALRRSVALNPRILDSWLSLAVSYTNESCYGEAYNSLESWFHNHTRYKHILENQQVKERTSNDHKFLSDALIQAARSNPGENLDPDVQIGLGILYNISKEYNKAVDCFQSALYKRPNDHLLWNKLGATLINDGKSEHALDAYTKALSINPFYARAHFNIASVLTKMGRNMEAAQHLLTVLSLQIDQNRNDVKDTKSISGMSRNIWCTLKVCCEMMNRPDLVLKCDTRDIEGFKSEFKF